MSSFIKLFMKTKFIIRINQVEAFAKHERIIILNAVKNL